MVDVVWAPKEMPIERHIVGGGQGIFLRQRRT